MSNNSIKNRTEIENRAFFFFFTEITGKEGISQGYKQEEKDNFEEVGRSIS